jgi:hypothetical protein
VYQRLQFFRNLRHDVVLVSNRRCPKFYASYGLG